MLVLQVETPGMVDVEAVEQKAKGKVVVESVAAVLGMIP